MLMFILVSLTAVEEDVEVDTDVDVEVEVAVPPTVETAEKTKKSY